MTIDKATLRLWELDQDIHSHPKLSYNEVHAHDANVSMLKQFGFNVTPRAYRIPTSFQTEYEKGGRLVVFNAEYDALPEIGHACGHNLIATASFAGFLAAAAALETSGKPGHLRLLGTPVEEGGYGKVMLIAKGAYGGVDACVMAHPSPMYDGYGKEFHAKAYAPHVASTSFSIFFNGKTTHVAASPWDGVNALDAIVVGYNAVSMLRQQMFLTDRVHGVIMDGGLRSNIIPDHSSVDYCYQMVYAPLHPNKLLSIVFTEAMVIGGSTDQGNIGFIVPVIHPIYGIDSKEGQFNHTVGFTEAAGTEDAFRRTLKVGNGLARVACVVFVDICKCLDSHVNLG
ncbi:hypothetical protein EDB80DRAFT_746263 [Ilyonectria destructans]|nr:hypothetical protein EDB80DRAFT_746263 [Ilyonectria destructans]